MTSVELNSVLVSQVYCRTSVWEAERNWNIKRELYDFSWT